MWLIGNWVPVKFDSSLRPLLYRTLVPIMHPNEDLVVGHVTYSHVMYGHVTYSHM